MSNEQMIALKAACVQAAATLVAAWWPLMRNGDVTPSRAELNGNAVECARVADLLYTQVSGNKWGVSAKALPAGSVHQPEIEFSIRCVCYIIPDGRPFRRC